MPTTSALTAIPALVLLVLFLLLHLRGKKKYSGYIEVLDKDQYGLRDLMTVGFSMMELSKYSYGNNFDRKLRRQLAELYDAEFTEFYLRVTWAAAATYMAIGLLLSALFGAATGDLVIALGGVALSGFLGYLSFSDVEKRVQQRHLQVSMDLPDLTNQILILSGAGLTLRAAIQKIAAEPPTQTPLYEALGTVMAKMENGASDEEAMDVLTTRCNMPEMRRFVSILLQNMQRGGADVLVALREIGAELWRSRKAAAKQLAEEASTKLLFPMMLMLLAVILLVAAPAVMSIKI